MTTLAGCAAPKKYFLFERSQNYVVCSSLITIFRSQIPEHGNTAEVVLTALHRNFLGVDEFLGMASIPLSDFDVYERPRNR